MEYFELSVHCEYWFDSKPLINMLLPHLKRVGKDMISVRVQEFTWA